MILHVVTFVWRDAVSVVQVEQLRSALVGMARALPGIRRYRCGPSAAIREGGADFVVLSVVDDEPALHAYLDHPEHLAIGRELSGPMTRSRQAVQLRLPALPLPEASWDVCRE